MTSADVATYLATLSAALTALIALAHSGYWRLSHGLTAFVAVWASCDALILGWPHKLWTPEFWAAREAGLALLSVVAALELGHGVLGPAARVWLSVCRRMALLLVPLALLGALGFATLGVAPRVGYRGLLVVDGAATLVLALVLSAVSLYELPRSPLTVTALRGLLRFFAVEVIYLASWEASIGLARWVVWAATATFVWAMLAIARQAASEGRTPLVTVARVSP